MFMGPRILIEACEEFGVDQIVYASTGKAMRPFSPDTYASTKKLSEWLLARKAQEEKMLISAGRFTHVADKSPFSEKLANWIDNGEVVKLHSSEAMFYVQSSLESSQLLTLAALEAEKGTFNIAAISNLGYPINLADLAIGAIKKKSSSSPIYFSGYEPGYEEKAYPGLYDPLTAGDVSPLICALEAPLVRPNNSSSGIDVFPVLVGSTTELEQKLEQIRAFSLSDSNTARLKDEVRELSWGVLESRLRFTPEEIVARAAKLAVNINNRSSYYLDPDHQTIDQTNISAHQANGRS